MADPVLKFPPEQKGAPPRELVPDHDDEFDLKRLTGLSVRFITDANGKVNELALSTPDGVFSAQRKP